jgi:hypothetical protein
LLVEIISDLLFIRGYRLRVMTEYTTLQQLPNRNGLFQQQFLHSLVSKEFLERVIVEVLYYLKLMFHACRIFIDSAPCLQETIDNIRYSPSFVCYKLQINAWDRNNSRKLVSGELQIFLQSAISTDVMMSQL